MAKPSHCDFCSQAFTWDDVTSSDIIKNERGEHMHTACYNTWCDLNPFVPPAPPFNGGCLTFESLPSNLSAGDVVSRETVGEPLSREVLAKRAVERMDWPTNTDAVEAMDWQLDD